eukprot:12361735-Heterocapsa_arctica.AAC.1
MEAGRMYSLVAPFLVQSSNPGESPEGPAGSEAARKRALRAPRCSVPGSDWSGFACRVEVSSLAAE